MPSINRIMPLITRLMQLMERIIIFARRSRPTIFGAILPGHYWPPLMFGRLPFLFLLFFMVVWLRDFAWNCFACAETRNETYAESLRKTMTKYKISRVEHGTWKFLKWCTLLLFDDCEGSAWICFAEQNRFVWYFVSLWHYEHLLKALKISTKTHNSWNHLFKTIFGTKFARVPQEGGLVQGCESVFLDNA